MNCLELTDAFERLDTNVDPQAGLGLLDEITRCGAPALELARVRLVTPNASDATLRNAIRVVAKLGADSDKEKIIAMLSHPSAGVRESAALALRNSLPAEAGSAEVAAALRRETRLETRVLLVGALARTRDPQWKPLYMELSVTASPEDLERTTAYGKLSEAIERALNLSEPTAE